LENEREKLGGGLYIAGGDAGGTSLIVVDTSSSLDVDVKLASENVMLRCWYILGWFGLVGMVHIEDVSVI